MNIAVADSDQDQATDIRYFDVSSRIGRVRYLAYGWALGLLLSPLTIVSLYMLIKGPRLLGLGVFIVNWIFATPIQFTFMIRRLHDLDRSGWWSLIYATYMPFSLLKFLDTLRGVHPGPLQGLMSLVMLVFVLFLIFAPGTDGANRFGPRPPPNSTGVVALAWSTLALPVIIAIAVVVVGSSLTGYLKAQQITKAVDAAHARTYVATRYFQENHRWPVDMSSVDGGSSSDPAIDSISTISYADGSYGILVNLKYSRSVEVWTTDGGETWHCGSPPHSTLSSQDLPEDCREDPPSSN